MEKTLVAVFDNQGDAQRALEALFGKGFSSSNARISSSESMGGTTQSTGTDRSDQKQSFGDKIASFLGFGDQDETYTEAVRRGSCVLTVDAASDDEAERASDIIDEYDPVDIDERESEWRKEGWQGKGGESAIPVVEEELKIGKRQVQRGGIRVLSRVIEQPVAQTVNLREEHAVVERRPVDRAVTGSDKAFQDQSFEVRGTAEEAVVGKTSRVVEEVVIGKESSTRDQTVQDSVRKTDVEVEEIDGDDSGSGQTRLGNYSGRDRRTMSTQNYRGAERRAM